MNKKKNLILVFCIVFSLIWVDTTWAGEPMKDKAGEILKAKATDLAGKSTTITLDRVKPKKPYKLGLLAPPLSNPYWVIITYGVINEAEIMGLPKPVTLATKTYQSLDQQASQMEDLLTRGVDAILIAPLSYEGSAAIIERAAKRVPIISVAQRAKSDKISCTVESDNYSIGYQTGEYLCKDSGGKAKVGMLKGPAGASWAMARVEGAKDVFAKYPGIKVVAEQWCSFDRAETLKITEDFITRIPDLDWLWTCVGPVGPIRAIEGMGKTGRVKVASTGVTLRDNVEYMKKGELHVMVGESAGLIGRVSVQQAIRVLNGEQLGVKYIAIPNITYHQGNLDKFDETLEWCPKDFQP